MSLGWYLNPYTYFQIIYKSLYVGWRGTAGRQKTNFPSKNSCGTPYKTKVAPY